MIPSLPILLNKINHPGVKNNLLINSIVLLTLIGLCFVLYSYLVHTLSLIIASCIGTLGAGYFIRNQARAQQKKEHINALHQAKYLIGCIDACNQNFQLHRHTLSESNLFPWEHLIHYYEFQMLLMMPMESFSFLHHSKEGKSLFELFLSLNTQATRINKALIDLHQVHYQYIEKNDAMGV